MELSVVIPVYNTEKFIKECIEGLTKGIEKKFPGEILLIDNGSKDGSVELCHELAEKFKFIRVLKCKTPGAAVVRNYGLKNAKGKFVWFVDSDDLVKPGTVTKLLARFKETDADGIIMAMDRVDESGNELNRPLSAVKTHLDDPKIKPKEWMSKFVRYGLGPVQVPARREFLLKNKLFFDEGMIHEDMSIMSSYILYTDKLASIEEPLYFYRQRSGSVLHPETWSERDLDIFKALELLSNRFEKAGQYEKWKDELEYFYIWNLLDDAAHEFNKFSEGKKHFQDIRKSLKSRFPNWRENPYFRKTPFMVQLNCRLAYHGIVR